MISTLACSEQAITYDELNAQITLARAAALMEADFMIENSEEIKEDKVYEVSIFE